MSQPNDPDWRDLLDEPPPQRGPRLIETRREYDGHWIDIKVGGITVIEGPFRGEAMVLQVAADVDRDVMWASMESGGEIVPIHGGQDLVLDGALLKGRIRLRSAATNQGGEALGMTRRRTVVSRDTVKEAFQKEQQEASVRRLRDGEPNGHDILQVLPDVPPGYYLLQVLHSKVCGWTETASAARFFLGDKPLYPPDCPAAQDAVDRLNACEDEEERRVVYEELSDKQKAELVKHFGRKSAHYVQNKRNRNAFGDRLRELDVLTHDAGYTGPMRLRVYDVTSHNWPEAALAWRKKLPRYGGRNAAVILVERR